MSNHSAPSSPAVSDGNAQTTEGGNSSADTSRAVVECMKLLRRKGFEQSVVHDRLVRIDAVMFCRVWKGVRETVLAYSESEAVAYRVRDGDIDPSDPFTVDPDHSMWQCGGDFVDVSGQLLALPPPAGSSTRWGRR